MNNNQYGYNGYLQNSVYPQYAGYPQNGAFPQYTGYQQNGTYPHYAGYQQYGAYPQYAGYWQMQQLPQQVSSMPFDNQGQKFNVPVREDKSATKEKNNAIVPERFTADDLSQESLDVIVTKFGSDIEDIYNLSPGQEWMFGKARKITSAFFLQTYLKINMQLKPSEFRQKLDEVCQKRANIRTAFAYRGLPKPYQVVLKNRRPELSFIDRSDKTLEELEQDIEKFRINDRRRGFDLENDPLFRMTIFKTAKKDTYAVVMSQPHINDDGVSEGLILKDIFIDYALKGKFPMPEMPAGSYKSYAQWIENIDKNAELGYWEDLLKEMRITRLPGRIKSNLDPVMNTLTARFSMDDGSSVMGLQARYHATINSIVQTAWGIMLQNLFGTRDAVFGTITSGRSSDVKGSNNITGSFVNAFPVRIKAEDDTLFKDLVLEVQKQIMISQEKAHCTPDEIGEKISLDAPVFDHLLNFHNMMSGPPKGAPPMKGFEILGMDFFDNLSTGFCLYFRIEGKELNCMFTYDRRSFTDKKIEILIDCYRQVMEQIIKDKDGALRVSDIKSPDLSVFLSAEKDEADALERMQSFLGGLQIFEGVDEEGILALAKAAEVYTYTDADVIIPEQSETDGLSIVMQGYVELYRTNASGWISTLKSLNEGKMLFASGLLEDEPTYAGASAITEDVKIVCIPRESLISIMNQYPIIATNLIRKQERLIRGYSMLWINSDY